MTNKNILLIFFLLAFVNQVLVKSQTAIYPVQADVLLNPPYSPRIINYVSPGANKMSVQILLKEDQGGLPLNVRLRVIIEDKIAGTRIATNSSYIPSKPIILQPGIPFIMDGSELATYLHPNNLEFNGLENFADFQNDQKLPEGYYTFKVEVLEYYRGLSISDPSSGFKTVLIKENDPPVWISPGVPGGTPLKLEAREPQFIIFSWLLKDALTFTAQYEFKMFEIPSINIDPNIAVATLSPIYSIVTNNTSIDYGINAPLLVPGKTYICQITANDPDNLSLFKNEGKSELLVFTWGDICKMPNMVRNESESLTSEKILWNASPENNTSFVVRYREISESSVSDYYTDEVSYDGLSLNVNHIISFLKAGHTYEYQVKALCNFASSDFTQPITFSLSPKPDTSITKTCGQPFTVPSIINQTPISNLQVGDTFNVGGFTASLIEVSKTGEGFTGKCIVNTSTIGVRIKCHFSDIRVNTSKQLYSGKIIADYNLESFVDLEDLKNDMVTAAELAQKTQEEIRAMVTGVKDYITTMDPAMSEIMTELENSEIISESAREGLELISEAKKDYEKVQQLYEQGKTVSADSLKLIADKAIEDGKQKLITEANNLLTNAMDKYTNEGEEALKTFVHGNFNRLDQNMEIVWSMTSSDNRETVVEELMALSNFSPSNGWSKIGKMQNSIPQLGDFYQKEGVITTIESTNITDQAGINSNIELYKSLIDELAVIKTNGSIITEAGQQINVTSTNLDIVVPANYPVSVYNDVLEYALNNNVVVNFINK